MKLSWRWLLLFLVLLAVAWAAEQRRHRHQDQHQSAQPGSFDYYVLALSWSPEFCYNHASNAQCQNGHFGFVVHGLWPQFIDGHPENCSTRAGPSSLSDMADIMPDPQLVEHEWRVHGTCSGLDPDGYFKLVRQAFTSVKVPARFTEPREEFSLTPSQIKQEFLQSNPRLNSAEVVVSCGNNYLTGISICLRKDLQPRECESLRDCRANMVKIPPVR
jgi:ribonuclease T2